MNGVAGYVTVPIEDLTTVLSLATAQVATAALDGVATSPEALNSARRIARTIDGHWRPGTDEVGGVERAVNDAVALAHALRHVG